MSGIRGAMMNFKKNDQIILMSAREDFDDHRFKQVINKTEKLLEKYPDLISVNFLRAKALYWVGRYAEAQKIMIEFQEELLSNQRNYQAMLAISLKNNAFIFAREIAAKTALKDQNSWLKQIAKVEQAYRLKNSITLNAKTRKLAHIGVLPAYNQVHTINDSLYLPLKEYLIASKAMLADPFTWQVSKTQILVQLMKLRIGGTVQLSWLDQQIYKIDLTQLRTIDRYPSLTTMLDIIDRKYAATDPIKLQLLEREIITQSNYIYPFFNRIILDPHYWVRAVVTELFGERLQANSSSERDMLAWIDQIHEQESKMKMI